MRRREFINAGWRRGGVALVRARAAAGAAAHYQVLGSNHSFCLEIMTAAFIERLRELGWIEGSNVAIEYRWAEARNERFAVIASGFVRLNVDVIVTGGNAALAVKQPTSAIPIIFVLAVDPVYQA